MGTAAHYADFGNRKRHEEEGEAWNLVEGTWWFERGRERTATAVYEVNMHVMKQNIQCPRASRLQDVAVLAT